MDWIRNTKTYTNLIRLHSARSLAERDHLAREVEVSEKMKSLIPILATGREVNQRMHDVRDKLTALKNQLHIVKNDKRYPERSALVPVAKHGLQLVDAVNETLSKQLQSFRKSREKRKTTEISAYLDEFLAGLSTEDLYNGVEFRQDLPREKYYAKIQRFYFQSALENLISNAAYFAHHQTMGSTPFIHFRVTAKKERIVFQVTDSGPGIQQSPMEKIFEDGETTKMDGFGIGLSIAKSIVTEHGGTIGVENLRGGGASFKITIPRER